MKRRVQEEPQGVLPAELTRFELERWVDRTEPVPAHWPPADAGLFYVFRARRRFTQARRAALTAAGVDWREHNRRHGWGFR